jgi:hypothetical protein
MGESVDIIDYTLLDKKGILARAQRRSDVRVPVSGSLPSSSSSSSLVPEGGMFSFLDASASAPAPSVLSPDLSALSIKVDDLSYKLERLTEQLVLLESKFTSVHSS